jgi:tRNA guanosine-2'-O-methyltransferase
LKNEKKLYLFYNSVILSKSLEYDNIFIPKHYNNLNIDISKLKFKNIYNFENLFNCFNFNQTIQNNEIETIQNDKKDENDENKVNYQRKIEIYSVEDLESELNPRLKIIDRKRQEVIVVASLIDRIPNLAGLSRTCEIFNLEKLCFNNLFVLKNAEFKSISVSSENWMNFEELKENDIPSYLIQKKNEGYSIVGVEQTESSTSIEKFVFPKKIVLLLGMFFLFIK